MAEMKDVIVIGGGPAGVTAALRARELGASVALIERGYLGGTCTNDGCVPTRVLAKAARLRRDAEQFSQYGLEGNQPDVNFVDLMTRVQQKVYAMHEKKQIAANLEQAGVTLYTRAGQARFVNPQMVELEDGTTLEGNSFILCAGGHARRFPLPGVEFTLTHSDVWSLKALPESLAIVGGAATGCQLASIFSAFGVQVTLLEVNPRLLRLEDEIVSRGITESFQQRGINIIGGIGGVDRIERDGSGLILHYRKDDQPQSVKAAAVVMAVGWVGNVESLNLEAAGVGQQRGYIIVNDGLQTSQPHIYAAGDITGRMMLVQSGSYDGRLAAENAVMGGTQPYRHMIVPHGGFTDPEYGSVGLTEEQARATGQEIVTAVVPYADMDRAVIDGRTEGYCKLIVSGETHRILGAHIIGEQALETIHLVAGGMAADMWIEHLAELEIAYPTFTAVVGLAARRIVRELGVMPLAPQWRTLGKPLAEWERTYS
jgi:pyruvate/2-oxoglutarate dehydrogenase complex dihydrolipoamide dehydrogenase (E3) component